MHQVHLQFPEIYDWVSYCYASDNPHLWLGYMMMRSVTGVLKGDPLGPLLFSITLQNVLKNLCENISVSPQMQTFFLDDGIIVARHETLRKVLDFLDSQEVK